MAMFVTCGHYVIQGGVLGLFRKEKKNGIFSRVSCVLVNTKCILQSLFIWVGEGV